MDVLSDGPRRVGSFASRARGGAEPLQRGGERVQVDADQMVGHVTADAGQVARPRLAQTLEAGVGEERDPAAAVAGGLLPTHESLTFETLHDAGHATDGEPSGGGEVAHPERAVS